MRDFFLEDKTDVFVEYWNGVGPTHRKSDESFCAIGGLKGGEVARSLSDDALVIADVEIKNSAARASCKLFGEMFGDWRNARMLNGDFVERFERMYGSETLAVLLENTEPARAVRGARGFIDAGCDFRFNDFANLFIDARRDRDIFFRPKVCAG